MVEAVTVAKGDQPLSQRRAQLAGPSGIKGLISNYRIFAIAVFASLGGFVYGCTSCQKTGVEDLKLMTTKTIRECSARS